MLSSSNISSSLSTLIIKIALKLKLYDLQWPQNIGLSKKAIRNHAEGDIFFTLLCPLMPHSTDILTNSGHHI